MIYLILSFALCALYQIHDGLTNSQMWIHKIPPQHFFVGLPRQSCPGAVNEEHKAVQLRQTNGGETTGAHSKKFDFLIDSI